MKEQKEDIDQRTNCGPGKLLALPFIAVGAWILYSRFMINHEMPLPDAVEAKRVVYKSKLGAHLNYYVDRKAEGRPLVLIHGVNRGASAYEMKPLFEHYRSIRPVFLLELPGFGFSDRPKRAFTPQYFSETILDFLETQIGEAVDLAAISLSSEFAARAANAMPNLFNSLAFISPTGLGEGPGGASLQLIKPGGASESIYGLLSNPIWSQAAFDLMSLRIGLTHLYRLYFTAPAAPEDLVDYAYLSAHQPGAEQVPMAAMSGRLSTPDVLNRIYKKVQTPTLVIYDRDPFARFDLLPKLIAANSNWQEAHIAPSQGMPQFEQLPESISVLDRFWSGK